MALEIPSDQLIQGTNRIISSVLPNACTVNSLLTNKSLLYLIYTIIICFMLYKYKDMAMIKIFGIYQKRGYVRVLMRMENLRLMPLLIKLDVNNNFKHRKLGNKLYALNDMYNYLIGYDTDNFPVFFYDRGFILPFIISNKTVTEEIKNQLKLTSEKSIKAMTIKLDPQVLHMVFEKRLLADAFNSAKKINWKLLMIIGAGVLAYLFFSGSLTGTKKEILLPLIPLIKPLWGSKWKRTITKK